MTQQEELALYKAALIDWEKPYDPYDKILSYTWSGLCHYFNRVHDIDIYGDSSHEEPYFAVVFPTLYKFRDTKIIGWYLWQGGGGNEGRKPRVKALKKAIKELEKVLSALGEK